MISYIKEKDAAKIVAMSTNAVSLDTRMSKLLLETGLDKLVISFDGATKKTYEKIRRGSDYDKVRTNIINMLKMRKQMGLNKPQVALRMTEMDETRSEIDLFKEQWNNLADSVAINKFLYWVDFHKSNKDKEDRNPCANLWTSLVVNWDGSTSFCCLDYLNKGIVGDVNRDSIYDIWNGERMKFIRLGHLNNDFSNIPLCRNCQDWKKNYRFWSQANIQRFKDSLLAV